MMARARLLGASLLMACSAGCAPDATRALAELSLQPIATLGPGAHTDASGMDSVILGHVTAMVEVGEGSVMVLDREYKRVAIYSSGGRVLPVVMAMYGNGPGELVEPIGLGVLSNGDISILDYAQHRVSIYDRTGQYLRSFPINVAEPNGLVVANDTLFISTLYADTTGGTFAYTANGELVARLFPVGERAVEFSRFGQPGAIGRDRVGDLLYSPGYPGTWIKRDGGSYATFGEERYPAESPIRAKVGRAEVRVAPAGTWGVGDLGGRIVLFYQKTDAEAYVKEGRYSRQFFLDSYGPRGEFLGTYPFPDSLNEQLTGAFAASFTEPAIYLGVNKPEPAIIKFRVIDPGVPE